MVQQNHYDVIIIGSGAGGGALAYKLAPLGKRILILERGEFLRREKESWDSREVIVKGRYNNAEGHRRLVSKLRGMLNEIRCENHLIPCSVYMSKKIPLAGVAHQNGTLRFGSAPQTSVLDLSGKVHDLDNLYVVDASFFVSSSAVNPALTIVVNALRVGDHLLERLG